MPSDEGRRLSVAPMMEWTDRHCRRLHRMLSRRARLYTEMVAADAVVRGPRDALLGHDPAEAPLALQLGGSDADMLAQAVRAAAPYGFAEINLNVGCPSDRVQSGRFGACLMREPELVARLCAAMIEAAEAAAGAGRAAPEITVKCRIGVDDQEPERALPTFLDTVAAAGVRAFAVHARKAWLQGLSPKENRSVPPLDYALARAMKSRRPDLEIALNGGVETLAAAEAHLAAGFDGVMIGRAAYHQPAEILAAADRRVFGAPGPDADPGAAARAMAAYAEAQMGRGVRLHAVTRHMLGLFAGRRGARAWRRMLSTEAVRPGAGPELIERALAEVDLAPAQADREAAPAAE